MPVWSKTPAALNVAITPTTNINNFVRVTVANPTYAEDITVCISKGVAPDYEIYMILTQTATPGTTLNFDFPLTQFGSIPISNGNINIAVSGHNYIPYSKSNRVIDLSSQYAFVDNYTINDNLGDNDQIADAGENISINTNVYNYNIAPPCSTTVVLSTINSYVTITDNSETFLLSISGSSINLNNAFSFSISPNCPDQENIKLTLTFVPSGLPQFTQDYICYHT